MFRKTGFLLTLMTATLVLFSGVGSFGADIEIYTNSSMGVEPNVLIIFDNSGSMNQEIPTSFYDPAYDYYDDAVAEVGWGWDHDKVYRFRNGTWNNVFKNSTAEIPCNHVRNDLDDYGFYSGRVRLDGTCGGRTKYLRTGNYLNYLITVGGSDSRSKLDIAKEIVQDFVMTTFGIRMGAMVFNTSEGGRIYDDGIYECSIRDMGEDEFDAAYANREALKDALVSIDADTWTPLAETLYEAGLYFKGEASHFNSGVTYTSPITDWCQKNYVIIITDGQSTQDRNDVLKTIGTNGDMDGDGREPGGANEVSYADNGSDYLDDVARYLYDGDLSDTLDEKQNIITYTIGFAIDTQLLQDTAENGHGAYHTCNDAQGLSEVFQKIIHEILETSSSFVAPVVPISQMEKTTSGSSIYLALFKPTENAFWRGNIKKFSIATEDDEPNDITTGDVLDVNENKATDDMGHILDTAVSFWGSEADGGDTDAGGVGQVLLDRTTPRSLYTYLGSSTDLPHDSNLFKNTNITPDMLGLDPLDDSGRDRIIDFVYGLDSYDENGDFDTTEKREWILGAFLHSRPVVVHYDGISVIFAGANGGMLHAFSDSDGSELWGFIPPDLLSELQHLDGNDLKYFVDGAPSVGVIDNDGDGIIEPGPPDNDRAILVFGERRGGNHYYALDVTVYDAPKFLWEIHPEPLGDFSEMGQSWSTPVIGKVKIGTGDKLVVFLGGGYDDINQDEDPVLGNDSVGRGIYVVDLLTGDHVWSYTYDGVTNPAMVYCIPSAIAAVDLSGDLEGYIDRLYVGDAGGQMWRVDIRDNIAEPQPASDWSAKMIFDEEASGRKIFYPPDVVMEEHYEMVFWGTGDRANPKNQTIVNRIYALKDKDPSTPLTALNNLYDATENLIHDGADQAERDAALTALNNSEGWYINLNDNPGEKVLAPGIVYFGAVYLTTFTPTAGSEDDPCYVGEGTARLYALAYKTGGAAHDFDQDNEGKHKSDRSVFIGSAIPSAMVIAIIQGKSTNYIGVGGGIFTSDDAKHLPIIRIYWRHLI